MSEKDIIFFQEMMSEYSLSAEAELRLSELIEEKKRMWMEERKRDVALVSKLEPKYIKCPYSVEERKKILEWIERHQYDAKALAVALWLSGGIAPQDIINLRKEDCCGDRNMVVAMGCRKKNSKKWERAEIVQKALNLHPEELEFVFMFQKDSEWKKLKGSSIQMKLYNICDEIGIVYKSFHKDAAIKFDNNERHIF